jgi:hypothetical protein
MEMPDQTPVQIAWVTRDLDAGGIEFAYVSAEAAGVPYVEIAHISPEIRAFFDHVKQEQQ